jgi:hypothetical protein
MIFMSSAEGETLVGGSDAATPINNRTPNRATGSSTAEDQVQIRFRGDDGKFISGVLVPPPVSGNVVSVPSGSTGE